MNTPDDRDTQLERLIDRTLRELPTREAPSQLESRVLREITRRAALPWWRRAFAAWPLPARAAFLVACVGFAKLALWGAAWLTASVESAPLLAEVSANVAPQAAAIQTISAAVMSIVRSIPPLWIYGGLAAIGFAYAALFGLSATAYRTLYANR